MAEGSGVSGGSRRPPATSTPQYRLGGFQHVEFQCGFMNSDI